MRFLVVLFAAIACTVAKPTAVSYAYSAIAPLASYPYAAAYSPIAYAGAPAHPAVAYAAPAHPALAYAAPAYAAPAYAAPAYAAPAYAYSAPAPVVAHGVKSQYHAQDEIGQASYGHAEPGQTHHAVQDAAGNKVGSFSFVNPEGKVIQTNYVADAAGYRVASNDLPVAPVHNAVPPAPVVDTPEVAAAKAAHFAEVAKAARSKRSATPAGTTPIVAAAPVVAAPYAATPYAAFPYVAHPYGVHSYGVHSYGAYPYATAFPHAYPTTNVAPVVTADGFIADTPEVSAAKANHFAQVAVAKARTVYPFIY